MKKWTGEERRAQILQWLKESATPVTGSSLAEKTEVSRQVIVQDIALLKAANESIIATSQGYLYIEETEPTAHRERVVACCHLPEETEEELNIMVDHGVTVMDVIVEHPFYGHLTGALMLSSRWDVQQFLDHLRRTKAALLSELTDGVHLHTLSSPSEEQLDQVCAALERAGFLISDQV